MSKRTDSVCGAMKRRHLSFKALVLFFAAVLTLTANAGADSPASPGAAGAVLESPVTVFNRTVASARCERHCYVRAARAALGRAAYAYLDRTTSDPALGEYLTLPNALVLAAVTRNYSRPANGHGSCCAPR